MCFHNTILVGHWCLNTWAKFYTGEETLHSSNPHWTGTYWLNIPGAECEWGRVLLVKNIVTIWHIQRSTQQFHSLDETGIFSSSKVGLMNLCTIEIWDWLIICCGGPVLSCPVHWRTCHNIHSLNPLYASSTDTPNQENQNVFRHFWMFLGDQNFPNWESFISSVEYDGREIELRK